MHLVRPSLALALFLLVAAAPAAAQPQLVIVTSKTKQYHRPSCPVVRDTKGVVAMNRGQAESRGYKAHPACENADSETQVQPGAADERQAPVFVYTAEGDKRYHRENCRNLAKDRKKVRLEEAGKTLWPCPVCRPPIRKRSPAIPK